MIDEPIGYAKVPEIKCCLCRNVKAPFNLWVQPGSRRPNRQARPQGGCLASLAQLESQVIIVITVLNEDYKDRWDVVEDRTWVEGSASCCLQ